MAKRINVKTLVTEAKKMASPEARGAVQGIAEELLRKLAERPRSSVLALLEHYDTRLKGKKVDTEILGVKAIEEAVLAELGEVEGLRPSERRTVVLAVLACLAASKASDVASLLEKRGGKS